MWADTTRVLHARKGLAFAEQFDGRRMGGSGAVPSASIVCWPSA